MAVFVKTVLGSHFGWDWCTTQILAPIFSGWIESDVHWGLADLALDSEPQPHGD